MSLGGLNKALDAVVEADGRAIVIVNPHHGDLSGAGSSANRLAEGKIPGYGGNFSRNPSQA